MNPIQIRAAEQTENNNDLIIEGKAIVFNQKTLLFQDGDDQYFEMIDSHALDGVDLSNVYLYYNHTDKAVARTKNKTLELTIKQDGLYFRAKLINTTYGNDLYKMVKSGLVDKCSFAFTIGEQDFDSESNTFTVRKIDKLFEVSIVDFPAYDETNVSVSARSKLTELEQNRKNQIYDEKRKKLILESLL